jgi:hypothetical protein
LSNIEKDIADEILRFGGLSGSKLGLRFDRVVIRVLGRLRAFAASEAPDGTTFLVTISAPILTPGKTAGALQNEIKAIALAKGPLTERSVTVHGNSVRVRRVRHAHRRAPKLIGFVHNPDLAPQPLLDLAERWLRAEAAG